MALSDGVVRAAGGVVSRAGGERALEVLLVHRPAYDDWTFPKGKADPGESDEACALREVEEETGLRCALEGELPATRYLDPQGRPKIVRYFAMRPLVGQVRAARRDRRGALAALRRRPTRSRSSSGTTAAAARRRQAVRRPQATGLRDSVRSLP